MWSSDETLKLYKVFLKEVRLELQKVHVVRKAKGWAWRVAVLDFTGDTGHVTTM